MEGEIDLKNLHCVGHDELLPLTERQVWSYLDLLRQHWDLIRTERIRRPFVFESFSEAMVFVNDVAALAEEEHHHPVLHVCFREVVIELTTNAVQGLSQNDFILARKIELCS